MEHSGHIEGLVGPYTFDNWGLAEGSKGCSEGVDQKAAYVYEIQ